MVSNASVLPGKSINHKNKTPLEWARLFDLRELISLLKLFSVPALLQIFFETFFVSCVCVYVCVCVCVCLCVCGVEGRDGIGFFFWLFWKNWFFAGASFFRIWFSRNCVADAEFQPDPKCHFRGKFLAITSALEHASVKRFAPNTSVLCFFAVVCSAS